MKKIAGILLSICIVSVTSAQTSDVNPTNDGLLSFNMPTQVFFKNNEYKRKIAYGYTLGGFRSVPNLEYQPLQNLSLNVGVNVLRYWGANVYSQDNFVGVPMYSDSNTQQQVHFKPFFRINWRINRNLNMIMGNLHTQEAHFLPTPLYNRELIYSSDGEEGLQFIYRTPFWYNDAWVNWQNFNFMNDVDRESFDVGLSGRVGPNMFIRNFNLGLDYAFIWHHNGGELDTISTLDLDHWANGRLGLDFSVDMSEKLNGILTLTVDYLFSKDMKNSTFAFESGHAWFPALKYSNEKCNAVLGYYDGKDMMTFYGTYFFNNLAQREVTVTYPHNQMIYFSFGYDINLNKQHKKTSSEYNLALVGEFFYKLDAENSVAKEDKSLSFGLGVVLTAKPKFVLHRFNN